MTTSTPWKPSAEQFRRLSGLDDEQQRQRILELFDQGYTTDQAYRVLLKLPLPDDLDEQGWPLAALRGEPPPPVSDEEYMREKWRDIWAALYAEELEHLDAHIAVLDASNAELKELNAELAAVQMELEQFAELKAQGIAFEDLPPDAQDRLRELLHEEPDDGRDQS
jgi:hypothetical protein